MCGLSHIIFSLFSFLVAYWSRQSQVHIFWMQQRVMGGADNILVAFLPIKCFQTHMLMLALTPQPWLHNNPVSNRTEPATPSQQMSALIMSWVHRRTSLSSRLMQKILHFLPISLLHTAQGIFNILCPPLYSLSRNGARIHCCFQATVAFNMTKVLQY